MSALGTTQQLAATVKDQNGDDMSGQTTTWASSDASNATVSGAGLVTAVANGTATITATSGAASATVTVTVQQVASAVTVASDSVNFASLGDTTTLTSSVADSRGNPFPGAQVQWATSAAGVATVSTQGLVTGVTNGTATIVASSGTGADTVIVVVEQVAASVALTPDSLILPGPGTSTTASASVFDAGGSEIASATVTWVSNDEAIATVDAAGSVTAIAAGTATVTVEGTAGGQSVTQPLAVVVNETIQITTTTLPNGDVDLDYGTETLAATGGGGSYTWTLTSGTVPTGLSLGTNGDVAGMPTVVETSAFTVEVTSGDGQMAQQALSLTINPPPVLLPTDLCSENPANAIATFEDANLTSLVRTALGLGAQDELRCSIASILTDLDASSAGIGSIVGIQNLLALQHLWLDDNSITDISAVSGLTNLLELLLRSNSVTDISALNGLTALTELGLQDNSITDISPVGTLVDLVQLLLGSNSVTDIGAVVGLTSLQLLNLSLNSVVDISALSGLTSLVELLLFNNPTLSNIQPLLDNTGLGSGDSVDLTATSVSCSDVTALRAKGVVVVDEPTGINSGCPV